MVYSIILLTQFNCFPLVSRHFLEQRMPNLRHLCFQEFGPLAEVNGTSPWSADRLPFLDSLITTYTLSNDFQAIKLADYCHLRRLHLDLPSGLPDDEEFLFPIELWRTLQDFSLNTSVHMLADRKQKDVCMAIAYSMKVGRMKHSLLCGCNLSSDHIQ